MHRAGLCTIIARPLTGEGKLNLARCGATMTNTVPIGKIAYESGGYRGKNVVSLAAPPLSLGVWPHRA